MEPEGVRMMDVGVGRAAAEMLAAQSDRRKRGRPVDRERERDADDVSAKRRMSSGGPGDGSSAPVNVAAARKAAAALVRESPTYKRLLDVEERIDLAIMRKQQDIKDALKTHTYTTPRVFRLYLCNTYRAQPRAAAAPPSESDRDDPSAVKATPAPTPTPTPGPSADPAPPGRPGLSPPPSSDQSLDVPSWSLRIQGHFLPVGEGATRSAKPQQAPPTTPPTSAPAAASPTGVPAASPVASPPPTETAGPQQAASGQAADANMQAPTGGAQPATTAQKPPLPAGDGKPTEPRKPGVQEVQTQQTPPSQKQAEHSAQPIAQNPGQWVPGQATSGQAPPASQAIPSSQSKEAQQIQQGQTEPHGSLPPKAQTASAPSFSPPQQPAVQAQAVPPGQHFGQTGAQGPPQTQTPLGQGTVAVPVPGLPVQQQQACQGAGAQTEQQQQFGGNSSPAAQPTPASVGIGGVARPPVSQAQPVPPGAPSPANPENRPVVPQTQLRCTDVFKRVVVELDRKTESSNNLIEWNRIESEPPADGFELSRSGSSECKALVLLYVDHKPERFKLSFALSRLIAVRTDTRSAVFMAVWQYIKKSKLQCADDRTSVLIDDGLRTLMPAHLATERVIKLNQLFEVIKMHMGPPDPIQIEYQIKLSGNVVDNQVCYDIQIDVPDDSLRESAQNAGIFGLQFPRSAEFVALNEKHLEALEQVAYHKRRRDFLESFAANPVEFINHLILSQTRDLKVISNANGRNPEEERRASFYQQQWVHEAVPRYLLRKAIADASKKTAETIAYPRT